MLTVLGIDVSPGLLEQSWMTPRKIRSVAEAKRATRTAGWRLERHRVVV